nr:sigma-70 family RNA polymerase sigma factor [Frigoribacterium sp. PhB160]
MTGTGRGEEDSVGPGAKMPFDRVVDRHGATVLRVCRSILRPADADDAWSETFLSALLAWPSLDPDTDLEAWLVTVARRKAVDVVRGDRRRAVPVEVLPEPPAGPSFDEVLARDDELLTAVRALPDRQRAAVVAHHLEGLSHDEVAAATGRSSAAVRRASSDGIAALRTRLTS